MIEGISVHDARMKAGAILARSHPVDADIVIGVPDSGLDAALGYSRESGIPYSIGLIKNKYIGRTFISPGQDHRVDQVKIKLSPVESEVKGKSVVLIDDSIVRGTTSARIVTLLRCAGAPGPPRPAQPIDTAVQGRSFSCKTRRSRPLGSSACVLLGTLPG